MNKLLHPLGFTLIELLVVVAIIGILASILGNSMMDAIRRADNAACKENLHTVFMALQSYRLDYGKFPPADGIADTNSNMTTTAWGCGPAANGYWTGVPLILSELGYCSESCLYCPSLKRAYNRPIEAYSSCSGSSFSGKEVPQWRFLRYAYDRAALDSGGLDYASVAIGLFNIDKEVDQDVWLLRCMHVDVGKYHRDRDIRFPHQIQFDESNPNLVHDGEYEITVNGQIGERDIQLNRR